MDTAARKGTTEPGRREESDGQVMVLILERSGRLPAL